MITASGLLKIKILNIVSLVKKNRWHLKDAKLTFREGANLGAVGEPARWEKREHTGRHLCSRQTNGLHSPEDRRRCWQHSSSDTACREPGKDGQLETSREASLLEISVSRKKLEGLNKARLGGQGDTSLLIPRFCGPVCCVILMTFLVTEKCNGEVKRLKHLQRTGADLCLSVRWWPGPWKGFI